MSEILRCDSCKAESAKPIVHWLRVDHIGFDVLRTFTDDPGPWHFCSLLCLLNWVKSIADRASSLKAKAELAVSQKETKPQ